MSHRSVFVGNIPASQSEEQLTSLFSGIGQVVNFNLVLDQDTGKPTGHGFCEYATPAQAADAVRAMHGYN